MYYVSSDISIRGVSPDSFRYLSHHGIKGQKWGIRRFQNEDGTLTNAGKKRLSDNGKHYTWLQDKLGYDERDRLKSAEEGVEAKKNIMNNANKWATSAGKAADHSKSLFDAHADSYLKGKQQGFDPNSPYMLNARAYTEEAREKWQEDEEYANKAASYAFEATDEYVKGLEKCKQLQKEYNKTPLGKLDAIRTKVSKGISFVKNLFKKKK